MMPPAIPDAPSPAGLYQPASQPRSYQPVARIEDPERRWQEYLFASDDLEAAPSIGPKMAERFTAIGIHTVGDFLGHNPHDLADLLDDPHFDAEVSR